MAGLLRRYLRMYWLKPFDAVNDAANARALLKYPWAEPILEIGSGDGVFSFIMHGGAFAPADDRYDHVDPSRAGDIFDVHERGREPRVTRTARLRYHVGVDLKWTHLLKCQSTGLYEHLVQAAPAPLPFRSEAFRTVFLYFPHGLIEQGRTVDYAATLAEVRRVLRSDGVLLMTGMNESVKRHFTCSIWSERFQRAGWERAAAYCRQLDAGRCQEIGGLSRSIGEWRVLLGQTGFDLVDAWTQVSPTAWRLYDVQTRPLLRTLILGASWADRAGLKPLVKAIWMCAWLPILALCYAAFGRPRRLSKDAERASGLVFAFNASPIPVQRSR